MVGGHSLQCRSVRQEEAGIGPCLFAVLHAAAPGNLFAAFLFPNPSPPVVARARLDGVRRA